MARARSNKDLVEFKIREINKYLSGSGQSLVLNKELENAEPYWVLKWEQDQMQTTSWKNMFLVVKSLISLFACQGLKMAFEFKNTREENLDGIRTNTGS